MHCVMHKWWMKTEFFGGKGQIGEISHGV